MFRFINSGLKQSATTLPNSIYHSTGIQKVKDDEKENLKLSLIPQPKADQTICVYKKNNDIFNCKYFENAYSFSERRNLIIEFSYQLGLFKQHPFWLGKIIGNFHIPKWIDETTNANKIKTKVLSPKIKSSKKSKSVEHNLEKTSNDIRAESFNDLGHDLNMKGCDAAELSNLTTAVMYWKSAAMMNYPPAQFNLGVHYECTKQFDTAEKWYRMAVDNGRHATAAYNLALLLNNKIDDHLQDEIKRLLSIAASQGLEQAVQCIDHINRCTS